jgi:restriction system protein
LKPREFEAFTAQLLVKLGYVDVELGKGSKDGGVDVTAVLQHSLGVERIIVQCKQFAIENKVGEPTVKQLLAEVGLRDAARGLLITTSSFTSGARTLIAAHRYRLSSIDGNDLISILRRFPKAPVTG